MYKCNKCSAHFFFKRHLKDHEDFTHQEPCFETPQNPYVVSDTFIGTWRAQVTNSFRSTPQEVLPF